MTELLAILAIGTAILVGYYLACEYGEGADAAYDAWATAVSIFYIIGSIFAILGGFVLFGVGMLVLFSYIAFTKGAATRDRVRSRIAS